MTTTTTTEPLAVDAAEAAAMFSCSVRHWRTLDVDGKVPSPVRLNRSVRWIVADLNAWALAGCPERLEWERRRDRMNVINGNARRAMQAAQAGGNRGTRHDSDE